MAGKIVQLNTPLVAVRKMDRRHQAGLQRLKLETVADLLYYFPFRYDDFSTITPISELKVGETNTVRGEIQLIENKSASRRRMTITEAYLEDETGSLKVVWFNQPFLEKYLAAGIKVTLSGKVEYGYGGAQMNSPVYEVFREGATVHTGRIVPVYSTTSNVTPKWIRMMLKPLIGLVDSIPEFLPESVVAGEKLMSHQKALREIHFPTSLESLRRAKERLAFEELFLLQFNALLKKKDWGAKTAAKIKFKKAVAKQFVEGLPWDLTNDQRKVAWEILRDLEQLKPMNRLVEGDVGSGKTVVAVMAAFMAVKNGYQAAVMAPTEVLAGQHFESLKQFLAGSGVRFGLYTRARQKVWSGKKEMKKSKAKVLAELASGKIEFIVGTQALLQDKVEFKRLGLVVIDEQHRFGVGQRARLLGLSQRGIEIENEVIASKTRKTKMAPKKANRPVPHLLSMTATPIPRTLALGLFGDLDLSIIAEKPKGRPKIVTKIVAPFNRAKAYQWIRQEIGQGGRVFIVCPLIEESDKLGVKSVESEYKKLSKTVFADLPVGLLHGKLKKEEKEKIIADFRAGRVSILVSTSVIEVGVDVPEATVMMIEGAERFGLAQLHQFRGRVGRGKRQSYCFLFTEGRSEKTWERLNALVETDDGFVLAEKDLEIRGPGEVYGLRQSGLPDLRMASLLDSEMVLRARKSAERFLKKEKIAKFPKLKQKMNEFSKIVHLE